MRRQGGGGGGRWLRDEREVRQNPNVINCGSAGNENHGSPVQQDNNLILADQ